MDVMGVQTLVESLQRHAGTYRERRYPPLRRGPLGISARRDSQREARTSAGARGTQGGQAPAKPYPRLMAPRHAARGCLCAGFGFV